METKIKVLDIKGKEKATIDLNQATFDGSVNQGVIHQAVVMYQANLRSGNACTKGRSEVRGGGKKPWRQKGTGRARAGTIRSPLWRGGGVTFGPKPRDYSYSIPKKVKTLALKSALNAKMQDGKIIVVDNLDLNSHKTKEFQSILEALKITNKCLIAVDTANNNLSLASRNIKKVNLKRIQDINTYDILKNDILLITENSLSELDRRITKTKKSQ